MSHDQRGEQSPGPTWAGLDLDRVRLMGVVNVTPDSFSDGGLHGSAQEAVAHGLRLVDEGADILDIGGESTRPGSDPVDVDVELDRVIPVIEALVAQTEVPVSVDTRKAQVMRAAGAAGARIVNDVSALSFDPGALATAVDLGLSVVLMHAQGDPKTMQVAPQYSDVVSEVGDFLAARAQAFLTAGGRADNIAIDPGIGFGKTLEHNLVLLGNLGPLVDRGYPVVLGVSRKRFIGVLSGVDAPDQRVMGSVAAALSGVRCGVRILRVHDVVETRQALSLWEAIASAGSGP